MKAIIIGSTGLVGSHLLIKLLNDSAIDKVISFVRRPQMVHPKLQEIEFSTFDEITPQKGDLYFCCLGTTIKKAGSQENFTKVDHDGVLKFATIAKEGKSLAIVSAAGADKDSYIFYNRVKGQTEEDLKKLRLRNLIIMRPSLLIGEREEKRPLEKTFIKAYELLSPVLPASLKSKAGTDVNVLADKMLTEAKKLSEGVKVFDPTEIS